MDAVGGDFDFGHTAEGEQELYEVLGRLLGNLLHNVGHGVRDGGLEHDTFRLQTGQVRTHELARLEHASSQKMLAPREANASRALEKGKWKMETTPLA